MHGAPCGRIRVRGYPRTGQAANPSVQTDCIEGCYGETLVNPVSYLLTGII